MFLGSNVDHQNLKKQITEMRNDNLPLKENSEKFINHHLISLLSISHCIGIYPANFFTRIATKKIAFKMAILVLNYFLLEISQFDGEIKWHFTHFGLLISEPSSERF